MNNDYIDKEIEQVEKNKIEGKKNAEKIEQELINISRYLKSYFGPIDPDRFKEFEKRHSCKKSK